MLLFGQLVRLLNSHSALPSILQNNLRELVHDHTADTNTFFLGLLATDTLALSGELVAYPLEDCLEDYLTSLGDDL